MEAYASKQDTIDALLSLGFIQFDDVWFDSPKETETGSPMVQLYIRRSHGGDGYWLVEVSGYKTDGFTSNVVWNGPRATGDTTNELDEFIEWLDQYNPGWR